MMTSEIERKVDVTSRAVMEIMKKTMSKIKINTMSNI